MRGELRELNPENEMPVSIVGRINDKWEGYKTCLGTTLENDKVKIKNIQIIRKYTSAEYSSTKECNDELLIGLKLDKDNYGKDVSGIWINLNRQDDLERKTMNETTRALEDNLKNLNEIIKNDDNKTLINRLNELRTNRDLIYEKVELTDNDRLILMYSDLLDIYGSYKADNTCEIYKTSLLRTITQRLYEGLQDMARHQHDYAYITEDEGIRLQINYELNELNGKLKSVQ